MRPTSRSWPAVAWAWALTGVLAGGCSDPTDAAATGDIVVFAAASLTEAFTAIGDAFEADRPGATVTFNFSASSEIASQVADGAPADVVAAADVVTMADLIDAGGVEEVPVVFAHNRSEIVVAPGNPLGIGEIADLADPDLLVVVCAPQVPCGAYAARIGERAGVTIDAESLEPNVKSVVTKVALGEADAGIAYATDVLAAGRSVTGIAIPDDVNVVADYPIATTTRAANPAGARAFVDFVLGPTGRSILADHGFVAP